MMWKTLIYRLLCIVLICSVHGESHAQTIVDAALKEVFVYYETDQPKRKVLDFKSLNFGAKINPITYVAAGSMYVYQNAISQQLTGECAFEQSCSDHMKAKIQRHGLFPGVYYGFFQWSSCDPRSIMDYPAYKRNTSTGKIMNRYE